MKALHRIKLTKTKIRNRLKLEIKVTATRSELAMNRVTMTIVTIRYFPLSQLANNNNHITDIYSQNFEPQSSMSD